MINRSPNASNVTDSTPFTPIFRLIGPESQKVGPPARLDTNRQIPIALSFLPDKCSVCVCRSRVVDVNKVCWWCVDSVLIGDFDVGNGRC